MLDIYKGVYLTVSLYDRKTLGTTEMHIGWGVITKASVLLNTITQLKSM